MNKKFFAALASATMAFTASGSIAVFADDFVEENTPSIDAGDLKPVAQEVVWNEENFGDLVTLEQKDFADYAGKDATLLKGKTVKTDDLAKVTSIDLEGFEGEIKGLEYFTGLKTFNDSVNSKEAKKITNKSLDFSANTALTKITIKHAPELAEIKLPKADEDEVYHLTDLVVKEAELKTVDLTAQESLTSFIVKNTPLTTLDLSKAEALTRVVLEDTKLASLDLSALEELNSVEVYGNSNLKDVVLNNGKKGKPEKLATLDLKNNALETVNLDYIDVATTLDLSGNHIGALDLSNTTVEKANVKLSDQTFYVSEKAANVNLKDAFPTLKTRKVTATNFDEDTAVLTLGDTETTYTYEVSLKSGTHDMTVKITAANPMNRLYNPNSGEHFYTADIKEKEALVKLGWQDEGYGWVAPKKATNDEAVFRLYNPNAGDHHYTTDDKEVKTLVAYGWKSEGIGWYSAKDASHNDKTVPVYRQYNPYANGAGSHNYTTDKAENDYLVSLGWTPEGKAWKALQ